MMHVSSKIKNRLGKKTVQHLILHDHSHNCLTSCLGWTNYHTITYTCTQSTFFDLLTFTTKTLILWWLHEMPTTTLTLTTCFKVKHTLSIFSRPIFMYTLGLSVLSMVLTTWQYFWLSFLSLLNTCIGVIYTMIVWGCYPIPLFCQQSSTTPDHTKTW